MLPTVQLHPDEVTVPKLLREQGYISGMLGKYHLGGGPACPRLGAPGLYRPPLV